MRAYPRDSPQAAARIVALTMLCDGHLSKSEVDAFERHGATQHLGLRPGQWHVVVNELCEDLLAVTDLCWHAGCRIDAPTLAALLDEVQERALRLAILSICVAVADADGHCADDEALVLKTAVDHWGLPHELLQAPTPPMRAAA
jgi:uncharacterized tellurite resistance protein B-like protein